MKNLSFRNILISFYLLSTTLFGANTGLDIFKYDSAEGWYWYSEDNSSKETKKNKVKMSPLDALKLEKETKTIKLLQKMVDEQKENKTISIAILEKLKEAFPNPTPKMYIDSNGKKCITNSSADCFLIPVIKEAQNIPALKNWLRNPSPENSKVYLKWMARYMKQIGDISNGSRFAFLNGGSDVYPMNTDYTYGDDLFFSKSEKVRRAREGKIIGSLKKDLAILMFIGQNTFYEKIVGTYKNFYQYDKTFLSDLPFVIVFPSKKSEKEFKSYVYQEIKQKGDKQTEAFIKNAKFSVRPDLYKTYNIRVTPSILAFYKDPKSDKKISQIVSTGKSNIRAIRTGLIDFLTYNGIISEKDLAADKSWAITDETVIENLNKLEDVNPPKDFKLEQEKINKYGEDHEKTTN